MDVAELIGTGGPVAALAGVAGFFLKAYLEKRKGDREDRRAERESESGIVETTKEALRIVRDQMVQMDVERTALRSQVAELEAKLRAKDSQVAELEATLRAKDGDAGALPKRRVPSQRSAHRDPKDLPLSGS